MCQSGRSRTSPQPARRSPNTAIRQLCSVVRWVESDTLLRTREQLLDDVIQALGFQRRGPRIVEAVNKAITTVRGS